MDGIRRCVVLADLWNLMEPDYRFILKNEDLELYNGSADDFPYRMRELMDSKVVKIESDYVTIIVIKKERNNDEEQTERKKGITIVHKKGKA